jgi:DnaD/phage-associated family protein
VHIEVKKRALFSDTQVPDIFITEYLSVLSGTAVKLYLYALTVIKSQQEVHEKDIATGIGCDIDSLKAALIELVSYQLAEYTEKGFLIADIKTFETEKIYKAKTALLPTQILNENGHSKRQEVIADINKTFFSGVMSPSWYGEIDHWFEQYHFEPQVVYALFNECMRRKKLESKAYISKVASNWSGQGIISYEDLNRYFLSIDKIRQMSKKIGQKLRKNITEYDEEIISKWINKMNYQFDIIDLALRKTSKLAHPNLEYANKLMEEWFSRSLKTTDEIVLFEAEKKEKYLAAKKNELEGTSGTRRKPANVANFDQRQYSNEYFEQMIDDVTKDQ